VVAIRVEPASIAAKVLRQVGVSLHTTKRLFNAELAILDDRGVPRAYLAAGLPELNTDRWRVFPDGRMETTYRLLPNLAWHDGTAFSANDFVFSWRVYGTPELGLAGSPPLNEMEDVLAPDERTVTIQWKHPYPEAGALVEDAFPPLPRHILEGPLQAAGGAVETFGAHPYWTREFVGLGPYRLERWEPGAFIEAAAFDRHALGRAKIARLKMIFISDANAALANLLAGEVHLAADLAIGFTQGLTLKQEWAPRNLGTVLFHPNQWRSSRFQLRPDLAKPKAILDVRVRKALAHALDKGALNDALFGGEGIIADTLIPPIVDYYPALDRALSKYPYDTRRSEQLMAEAGFERGADGFYSSPAEGRVAIELKTNASSEFEAEMSIMASGWRQAGFDMQEAVLPAAQAQDPQVRATYPGLFTHNTGLGEAAVVGQTSTGIPRPENRWTGNNRGGWINAEYDRLVDQLNATLDRNQRVQLLVQATRIFSEELPSISIFFATQPMAHVAALRGPTVVAPSSVMGWNVHEWEFL
jgi:peptide/nickel transport system substrate-binding protein